jgi:AcrR family transcriptional regulator
MSDETDETDETGLPAGIAAAWGIRERPGKGPKRGLSLGRIVQAAVRTAVDEGLPAVSMNRVAAELGTAAMSLYRYVSAKDELIDLMVDEVYGAPPTGPRPDEGWRTALARWANAYLAVYREHPWLVRVPITGPPIMPNAVRWFEHAMRSLAGTGLSEGEKVSVVLLVSGLVRNYATLEVQLDTARQAAGDEQVMPGYGRMLGQLTDSEHFPALHAAIDSGIFDQDDDDNLEFDFGLARVLDGIEVLIRDRGVQTHGDPST